MFQHRWFYSHPAPVYGFRRGTKAWREPKLTFCIVVHKEVTNEISHRKHCVDESGEYPYKFKSI